VQNNQHLLMLAEIPGFGAGPATAPPANTTDNTVVELQTLSTFFFPWPFFSKNDCHHGSRFPFLQAAFKQGGCNYLHGGSLNSAIRTTTSRVGSGFQSTVSSRQLVYHFQNYFLPLRPCSSGVTWTSLCHSFGSRGASYLA
jgi:hypothetical protein